MAAVCLPLTWITTARFTGVPQKLRQRLAQLVGVDADDVIPTNGASYGLHLLANGLPLDDGDEVLLMSGDFPSDILPWLGRVGQARDRREAPLIQLSVANVEFDACPGGSVQVALKHTTTVRGYA